MPNVQINITTVQTALAVIISNMITGVITWLGAWSQLPLASPENAAFVTIISVMLSTIGAVAIIGWYTRTLALVNTIAPPGQETTKIVTDNATAKALPDNPNVTSMVETKVVPQ